MYWLGVKETIKPTNQFPVLTQWECYELEKAAISLEDSLSTLIRLLKERKQERLITQTSLLIAPGYKVKTADAILTNFHQPRSTLLLFIAAFIGTDWKKVYQHALENDYRFLSYGDSSLLWNKR